jgi:hypothetical protein
MRHAHDTGLKSGVKGDRNGCSKLDNVSAMWLIYGAICGESNVSLGEKFNLHPRYVSLVRHRRRWKWLWDEMEKVCEIGGNNERISS